MALAGGQRVASAARMTASSEAAIKQLKADTKRLQDEVDAGDKEIGRKTKEITKLQNEATIQKELYDSSIQERKKLQDENQELQKEIDRQKAESMSKGHDAKLTEENKDLKRQVDQLKKDLEASKKLEYDEKFKEAHKELTATNKKQQSQLDGAVAERTELQKKIDDLEKKNEDLTARTARYSQTATALTGKNEKIQSMLHLTQGVLTLIQDKAMTALEEVQKQTRYADRASVKPASPRRDDPPTPRDGDPRRSDSRRSDSRQYPSRERDRVIFSPSGEKATIRERESTQRERALEWGNRPGSSRGRGSSPGSSRGRGSSSARSPISRPGTMDQRRSRSPRAGRTTRGDHRVPPESLAARKDTARQQSSVPPNYRTPMRPNRPGQDGKSVYSAANDPARRPPFSYTSMSKPARGEGPTYQSFKASNKGFAYFLWRTEIKSGPKEDMVGYWKKGEPRYADYGNRYSGLYPVVESDVRLYGDGGWKQGESCEDYRRKGPLSQMPRGETHGLLWCFRQPFNHPDSRRAERNDWLVPRRENRRGYHSHGIQDDDSVSSISDQAEAGDMSPRMRDALVARYDTSRYEDTARGDIDPIEFRIARDAWQNAVAFDIEALRILARVDA